MSRLGRAALSITRVVSEIVNALSAHVAASDPHTGYQKESEKDQNSGYVGRTANGSLVLPKTAGAGVLVDTAAPDYGWIDLVGAVYPKTLGAGSPTLATSAGLRRQYAYGVGDDGDANFHLHHDYPPGTDIYGHIHWYHNGTGISGGLRVRFNLGYAKGHNQAEFPATDTVVVVYADTPDIATVPALRHRIDEVQMSAPGGLISSAVNVSITSGTPTLTAASALFSPGDVSRTIRVAGAGAAGGNLDTTVLSYTSSTRVTLAANASTTVTAQPNFKYRVLNTDDLEVDGVLETHYDVDEIPNITGGAGKPLITFIDFHTRTVGAGGTKNRTPSFYA
jgi:hypothetical protein